MAGIERKSMDNPTRRAPLTRRSSASCTWIRHRCAVERATGWRWSECIKPIVGGESCQAPHLGYMVSGRLHVASDDGTEIDLGPGDVYRLEPGHDAWCSATNRP
jgi:hypothetical protein